MSLDKKIKEYQTALEDKIDAGLAEMVARRRSEAAHKRFMLIKDELRAMELEAMTPVTSY